MRTEVLLQLAVLAPERLACRVPPKETALGRRSARVGDAGREEQVRERLHAELSVRKRSVYDGRARTP